MDHVEELIDILKNERLWSSKSSYFLLKPLNFFPLYLKNKLGCLSMESIFILAYYTRKEGWHDIQQTHDNGVTLSRIEIYQWQAFLVIVILPSVILPSAILSSVILLNVILPSVILSNVILSNVILPSIILPSKCHSAKCHSAKCHSTNLTLQVSPSIEHAIMWSVIQKSVAMPHIMAPRDPSQV